MKSCCYQSCNVCHIYHEVCAAFICDVTETCKINGSCISTCACDDHFRFALHSDLFYFIIIDKAVIVYTVRYDVEMTSGEVYRDFRVSDVRRGPEFIPITVSPG